MPLQRKFLIGSRWTALVPRDADRARHFEVVACAEDVVALRPVLGGPDRQVPLAELDDRSRWASGWQSLTDAR